MVADLVVTGRVVAAVVTMVVMMAMMRGQRPVGCSWLECARARGAWINKEASSRQRLPSGVRAWRQVRCLQQQQQHRQQQQIMERVQKGECGDAGTVETEGDEETLDALKTER